jgi:hypothetical protein
MRVVRELGRENLSRRFCLGDTYADIFAPWRALVACRARYTATDSFQGG